MTPLSGAQVGYDLEPRVASIQVSAWSETDRGLMQTAFQHTVTALKGQIHSECGAISVYGGIAIITSREWMVSIQTR